jgi:hypothetical protein
LPEFPVAGDGVMFVGHNLDGAESFRARLHAGAPHGDPRFPHRLMPTWRNLYRLLSDAALAPERCFFTNAYVGLNSDGSTAPFRGARDPWFRDWCGDFLGLQISVMQPKAVVALGGPARGFLATLSDDPDHWRSTPRHTRIGTIDATALAISHPSRPISGDARREEARILKLALEDRRPGLRVAGSVDSE